MNATQADNVRDEIQEIMNLRNKYCSQTRKGIWLKLRRDVLGDTTGIWIDRQNHLIDLACIEDALWDSAARRIK
jgi:hypothetical protein